MRLPISVILPTYNVMPHIKTMIESLYNSTNVEFRLIVIDAYSTDGTYEFLKEVGKKVPNIEVYKLHKNGLTNAINYGIEKAGQDNVYITQSDVIHFRLYGRDWLLEMFEAGNREEVGLVTNLGGTGISGKEYVDGFRWVGTWSLYLPRKTIDKVGLFDENMGPGDDIDYCYRLSKTELKPVMIDYWTQHHRLTEHGDADEKEKIDKMSKYFKKKWKIEE